MVAPIDSPTVLMCAAQPETNPGAPIVFRGNWRAIAGNSTQSVLRVEQAVARVAASNDALRAEFVKQVDEGMRAAAANKNLVALVILEPQLFQESCYNRGVRPEDRARLAALCKQGSVEFRGKKLTDSSINSAESSIRDLAKTLVAEKEENNQKLSALFFTEFSAVTDRKNIIAALRAVGTDSTNIIRALLASRYGPQAEQIFEAARMDRVSQASALLKYTKLPLSAERLFLISQTRKGHASLETLAEQMAKGE